MNILLHACCGPCATYPVKQLAEEGHKFQILYFNPNIHPLKEFKRRLNTLREFCQKRKYKLIENRSYPLEECLVAMMNEPTVRCAYCYRVRMEEAARYAKEHGFDAFTTTLLVSPFQKHEMIIQAAEAAAAKYDIPFYYEDFRVGYEEGVAISIELEMYRQPYCGCIFSERDRYTKKPKNTQL